MKSATPRTNADVYLVVCVGGIVGSLLRWAIQQAVPPESGSIAWATMAINVVGCLLIGALVRLIEADGPWHGHRYARPFLGVGILGGFTTFSAIARNADSLIRDGEWSAVAIEVGLTLSLGVIAVLIGRAIASAFIARRT